MTINYDTGMRLLRLLEIEKKSVKENTIKSQNSKKQTYLDKRPHVQKTARLWVN